MLRYSARWPRSLTHRLLYIARPSRQRIPLHESVVPPLLRFMVCGVTCLSASAAPSVLTGSTYALIASAEILM
jgi:hypothetical protein